MKNHILLYYNDQLWKSKRDLAFTASRVTLSSGKQAKIGDNQVGHWMADPSSYIWPAAREALAKVFNISEDALFELTEREKKRGRGQYGRPAIAKPDSA